MAAVRRQILIGVLALAGAAVPLHATAAGVQDHLLCYKIRDPAKLKVKMDLTAEVQKDFSQRGCVVVKAIEFCVPVTKTNVGPAPQPLYPNIVGQSLTDDYLCYQTKCSSDATPQSRLVGDQLGLRPVRKWKVGKVCIPAKKRLLPCGPTGIRMCGGTCPDATQTCQMSPTDAGCECVPNVPGCFVDTTGKCTGTCSSNPAVSCVFDAAGICGCDGSTTTDCQQSAPACGGVCPGGEACSHDPATGSCTCVSPPPCGQASAPACNGTCPVPGSCVQTPGTTICSCQ